MEAVLRACGVVCSVVLVGVDIDLSTAETPSYEADSTKRTSVVASLLSAPTVEIELLHVPVRTSEQAKPHHAHAPQPPLTPPEL